GGISAGWAVLEYVPPVAIAPSADRHVIGNDIEHLTEPALPQAGRKAHMRFAAAQFVVHPMMIDDIVAVLAAGRSLQIRRAIDMGNAKPADIIRNLRRSMEAEAGVQLQTICGDWNPGHSEVRQAKPDIVSRQRILDDVQW